MKYVYVLDKHGKPLMPTTRFSHVRRLLKNGKAVAVSNNPFVIRLKYDSTHYTQLVYEGFDPGAEHSTSNSQLPVEKLDFTFT